MAAGTQIASLYAKIGADITDLERKLGKSQSLLMQTGRSLSSLGGFLTKYLTVPLAAAGVAAFKWASDFDQAMRNVNSVLLLNEEQYQSLSKSVLEFTYNSRASATEAAEALLYVAQAGFRGKDAFRIMEASAHAAGAAFTDTTSMARLLAGAINAFSELTIDNVTELNDLFIYASQIGAGSIDEFSSSIARAFPAAASLGVSIQEVIAGLTVLHRTGLSASVATTYLYNVFQQMKDPSEALKNFFWDLGYATADVAIESIGLVGVMKELSDAEREGTIRLDDMFGAMRGLRGAQTLVIEGGQMLASVMQDIGEKSKGAMERARAQQYATFAANLEKLKNVVKSVAITFGNVLIPPLTQLAKDIIPEVLRWLDNLEEAQVKSAVKWAAIAAAIGPAIKALGFFVQVISGGYSAIVASITWIKELAYSFRLLKLEIATGQMVEGVAGFKAIIMAAISPTVAWSAALLAVAAAAAMVIYRIQDIKRQARELESVWSDHYQTMIEDGATALDIANDIQDAQKRMNDMAEDTDLFGTAVIRAAGGIEAISVKFEEGHRAITIASQSYNDYVRAMFVAGYASGVVEQEKWAENKANWALVDSGKQLSGVYAGLSEELGVLSQYMTTATADQEAQAEQERLAAQETERYKFALDETAAAMKEAGFQAGAIEAVLSQLETQIGDVTDEETRLREDTTLLADAYAAGLISTDDYVEAVGRLKEGYRGVSAELEGVYRNTLSLIELNEKRGQAFASALDMDLTNLISEHGEFVNVQASSTLEVNAAKIAAYEAEEAYQAYLEAVRATYGVIDPEQYAELANNVRETENAYLEAAEKAKELEAGIHGAYSETVNHSEEIRKNYIKALYDGAVAAGAPLEALVLLAGATNEWSEAQIDAALKAAAMQLAVEQMVAAIKSGSVDVETAIGALDNYWAEIEGLSGREAIKTEIKLELEPTLDIDAWLQENDPFLHDQEMYGAVARNMSQMGADSFKTFMEEQLDEVHQSLVETTGQYDYETFGSEIATKMTAGYTGVDEEGTIKSVMFADQEELSTMWTGYDWGTLGSSIPGGIKTGWDATWPATRNAILADLAALKAEVESQWQIRSPSKVFARIGAAAAEGLTVGWKDRLTDAQQIFAHEAQNAAVAASLAMRSNNVQQITNNTTESYASTVQMPSNITVRNDQDLELLAYKIAEIQRRRGVTRRRYAGG